MDALISYLDDNLSYCMEYFKSYIPEIKVRKPQGTYLVWLDCRSLNMEGKALHKFMTAQGKIGLNNGMDFGPGGQGFLRINIACPRSTLKEGLHRIKRAVDIWRKL